MFAKTMIRYGFIFFLLIGLLVPGKAKALDGGFDINHFNPPTDKFGLLTLDGSHIYEQYMFGAGFFLHFVQDSLEFNELDKKTGDVILRDLVGPRLKLDLNFAIAFCKYYELGLDIPIVAYQDGMALGYDKGFSKSAFGDIRIHNKIRALSHEEYPVGLAAIITLAAPSGDTEGYAGNQTMGAEFKAVVDGRVGPVLLVGNLGYRVRDEVIVAEFFNQPDQQIDDEFLWGIGAEYETPIEGLSAITEFSGTTLAEKPFKYLFNSPTFWRVGARYDAPLGFYVSGALEVGLAAGYGAAPAGFMVNIGWAFDRPDTDDDGIIDKEDACPEKPEDKDGFEDADGCPDIDNDKDGYLDKDDQCPNEPEDFDDFHDEDGCPEEDNDEDNMPDEQDQCPLAAEDYDGDKDEDGCPDYDADNDGIGDMYDFCLMEPEDKDGHKDKDGCPDPDNDGDGVLDVDDKCVDVKEDKDGFEDEDGCPDPDNDMDGVFDANDKCPTEKETINGNDDEDGCPDRGWISVIDRGDHIEFKKPLKFKGQTSLPEPESYSIMDQIALMVRAHGDFEKLIIEGHTDNQGEPEALKSLSLSRARWVRAYLANKGIPAEKIEFKGYGMEQPIRPNSYYLGRQKNNRIEIKFVHKPGTRPDLIEANSPSPANRQPAAQSPQQKPAAPATNDTQEEDEALPALAPIR